ncbi:MAG: FkbM family methyltransferase [Solirubrobacteraceae bacterium]
MRAISGVRDIKPATRGWLALQRARLAHKRHPDLGEISAYCFYATKLRFRELAFDIGASRGAHTAQMINRGARVVAIEPQPKIAAHLAERFPTATVLVMAVSDEPGQAPLHLFRQSDELASLDARWGDFGGETSPTRERSERVAVTTVDELIDAYGEPALVKIDAEGFDHRVLRGLSRPVDHILFELHAARRDDAAAAFERLEELGRYEYRVSPAETWRYDESKRAEAILADVPDWGSVYARRIR